MPDHTVPSRDMSLLAPKFREAVEAAIADCAAQGYPVKVAEALRSQERQAYLYAQGRTRPGQRVTNAPTNLTSWHGYGLAVDVIHETKGYAPGKNNAETTAWFTKVGQIFKAHGCAWGGDWRSPDMPHVQFGNMPASPQTAHKVLKQSQGNRAVWHAVGAADGFAEIPVETRLERGNKGYEVAMLQLKLGIPNDGTFGRGTEAAVKAFQSAHGLTADGIVGAKTWAALGV